MTNPRLPTEVHQRRHPWGLMVTIHVGAMYSIPLHPEHQEAIARVADSRTPETIRDETGRDWLITAADDGVVLSSGSDSVQVRLSSVLDDDRKDGIPQEPEILQVTSRRFRWTAADGFVYRPGSDSEHGLNRTRQGALDRIASHQTFSDRRQRAFLESLLGAEAMETVTSMHIRFEDGAHVVEGRRFEIKPALIGA